MAQFAAIEVRFVDDMDRLLCFDGTLLLHLRIMAPFPCVFHISCIKYVVTYSIVKSFIGIVSKAVIKYSYDADKLSLTHVPPSTQVDLQGFLPC